MIFQDSANLRSYGGGGADKHRLRPMKSLVTKVMTHFREKKFLLKTFLYPVAAIL